MRALLVLLVVARTAAADAPSGYQCSPGTANVGVGCKCPAGYAEKRIDENVASCAATAQPDLKAECTKLGAAIAAGKTKVDAAFFAGAPPFAKPTGFRAIFGPAFAEECTAQKWTTAQRSCFATAQDASVVWGCLEKLSVVHRDRIEAAVTRSLPPWIEVTAKGMRLYGRIAFAGNAVAPDSFAALNALSNQMVTDPTLRFEVQVHTSNTGTHAEQLASTQQKADAVRRHLLDVFKHGEDRIVAKGYAGDQPINDNRTAEGRAQNRRVEFRRLSPGPAPQPVTPPPVTPPPVTPPVERPDPPKTRGPPAPVGEVGPPTTADLATFFAAIPGRGLKLVATFHTVQGAMRCALYPGKAPLAVANFIGLATGQKPWLDSRTGQTRKTAYYNGLTFHRVIPGFMIQGGDPIGTGTGNPGYRFRDELHDASAIVPGALVMANAGPDTNGSQFFISEVRSAQLDKKYSVFGQCDAAAIDVVKTISGVDRDSRDKPRTPVVIERVVIEKTQ